MASDIFIDPKLEPPVGLPPALIAAGRDQVDKLSKLVNENAVLVDHNTGETVLHVAARNGATKCTKWLVDRKVVDSSSYANNGYTAVHYAVLGGHLGPLQHLLTQEDRKLESKLITQMTRSTGEEESLSVLCLAAIGGSDSIVEWILNNFSDKSNIFSSKRKHAIHFAAAYGHLNTVNLLVDEFGHDIVNFKDEHGTTPVFLAAQQGKLDVLSHLVNEFGADALAEDKDGYNSIHTATQAQQVLCVKWLVAKLGQEYIVKKTNNEDGTTPLHMAAASGNTEILKFFLENLKFKDDINTMDNMNYTPLHDAAEEGMAKAVQLLLRHGARVDIKNNKKHTPYDTAREHPQIAAMIEEYTNNQSGTSIASKKHSGPRTTQQEADELSGVIKEATDILQERKAHQLSRQGSFHDHGEGTNIPQAIKKSEEDHEIEHTLGPNGDLYAKPRKVKGKHHTKENDLEDFGDLIKHNRQPLLDENPYAVINDSASVISRDRRSRVKRYHQDSDSDVSGMTGPSDRYYGNQIPGWYPGAFHQPIMFKRKGPRSVTSSKQSSRSGSQRGYPMMGAPPIGFGFPPYFGGMPYPQFWGQAAPGFGMSTDARMQMEMMQQQGPPHMMASPMGFGLYPPYLPRSKNKKKERRRERTPQHKTVATADGGGEIGVQTPKKYTDQDIGYGPSADATTKTNDDFDHPTVPVTDRDGKLDTSADVNKFDSNIVMLKKSDQIREVEGMTLNPSKSAPQVYDGRYDEFIMSDSDDEFEVENQMHIGLLAEAAAILVIGCVAGLKGLSKIRKKNASVQATDKQRSYASERHGISSAWDDTHNYEPARKRRGSIDDSLKGMTPEEFANVEDWERETWTKEPNKKKNKKDMKKEKLKDKENERDKKKGSSTSAAHEEFDSSDLITPELQKESYQSVSKHLGQKILGDALGAMQSSMLNIAPSGGLGSRLSLNVTSEDDGGNDDDDDDFGDTISLLEGKQPGSNKKHKRGSESDSAGGDITFSIGESGGDNADESGKRKKNKKDKMSTEKKEKREKKDKEKREKKEKKDKKSKKQKTSISEDAQTENKSASGKNDHAPKDSLVKSATKGAAFTTAGSTNTSTNRSESHTNKSSEKKDKKPSALPSKITEQTSSDSRKQVESPGVEKTFNQSKTVQHDATKPSKTKATTEKAPSREMSEPPKVKTKVVVPSRKAPPPPKMKDKDKGMAGTETREVENKLSIFDTESEDEELPQPPVPKQSTSKPPPIIMDEESKNIFGEDGLAELNEALRQLEDIQYSIAADPTKMFTSRENENERESERKKLEVERESGKHSRSNHKERAVYFGEMPKHEEKQITESSQDSSDNGDTATDVLQANNGTYTQTKQSFTNASQQTGVAVQSTGVQGTSIDVQSIGVQGTGLYSSPFEQNVLSILQALNESMQQMRNNPSSTQNEINEHELLQQQMIQSLISFSQHDPDVFQKLLSLLQDQQTSSSSSSDKNQSWEDLQQKLIEAQERQRKEASEHFQSQAEFQQEMKKRMEETAEMQMKGIQSNFDRYAKMMSEQLAEQMHKWEMELKEKEELQKKEKRKKRKKGKNKNSKHKKHGYSEEDLSSDSSSGLETSSGLIQPSAKVVIATKPEVKTDTAKIFTQRLLDEDDLRTTSQSSLPKLLAEKKQSILMRRGTRESFDQSRDAFKRFESFKSQEPQVFEDEEDDDESDDETLQFQHARPVTLKRADIKTQLQNSGTTPNRSQALAEKRLIPSIGIDQHEGRLPSHTLAGAGDELAAVLKKRGQN